MEERTTLQGDQRGAGAGGEGLVLALVAAWARAQSPTSAEQVRALAESRRAGSAGGTRPVRSHLSA